MRLKNIFLDLSGLPTAGRQFIVLPMIKKKNFVSISFASPDRLQILALNSKKSKVVKYSTLEIPSDLIRKGKVTDTSFLAKILKGAWSKLGIKEKMVVLVVPEISTFTKLFELPGLQDEEVDEALKWQAQDILPGKISDMIMDWKIIGRTNSSLSVMAVAMEKEILEGYVEATEAAGLFPQAVEIPSISIARLTDKDGAAKLILYDNFGEGLIVIAQGEKIFGSSVVSLSNKDQIIKTAEQIMAHFKNVSIKNIVIGGGIDPDLVKALSEKLGLNVQTIKVDIRGISKAQVQEYLVAYSLQLRSLNEPADIGTINLLPPDLVKVYESKSSQVAVWGLTLTVSLFVWTLFFATLGAYLYISQQISVYNQKAASKTTEQLENEKISNQINNINDLSTRVLAIKDISILPQEVFNGIALALPSGISLTDYILDLETGKISVSGVAVDRPTLVTFKQNLEKNAKITDVNVPISSFEVESNLKFDLTFKYMIKENKTKGK